MHRKPDYLLIGIDIKTLSPRNQETFVDVYQELKYAMSGIEATTSLQETCLMAVKEIKRISGFDKVMIAEGDMDDQHIFVEILAEIDESIHIDVVDNGGKLIQLMETLKDHELPHLLVLYQNMPLLKTSETINVLRGIERFRDIPAVIYSAYHDSKFIEGCKSLKIDLLLKPDTFRALNNMIRSLVDRHLNGNVSSAGGNGKEPMRSQDGK